MTNKNLSPPLQPPLSSPTSLLHKGMRAMDRPCMWGRERFLHWLVRYHPSGYLSAIWHTAHEGINEPDQSGRGACNPGALRPWRLWL